MAKKDFDTTALLFTLEGRVGKTLQDIAGEFRVSTRTVQRRIAELRSKFQNLDIREDFNGRVKTFRYIRKGITVMGFTERDLIMLHRLQMAALMFRHYGMVDHAESIESHVEHLMAKMPRATHQSCKRSLAHLRSLERITAPPKKPVAKKGMTEVLQLATIAQQTVSLVLSNRRRVRGSVQNMSYDLRGRAEVTLRLQNGPVMKIALTDVREVEGMAQVMTGGLLHG